MTFELIVGLKTAHNFHMIWENNLLVCTLVRMPVVVDFARLSNCRLCHSLVESFRQTIFNDMFKYILVHNINFVTTTFYILRLLALHVFSNRRRWPLSLVSRMEAIGCFTSQSTIFQLYMWRHRIGVTLLTIIPRNRMPSIAKRDLKLLPEDNPEGTTIWSSAGKFICR